MEENMSADYEDLFAEDTNPETEDETAEEPAGDTNQQEPEDTNPETQEQETQDKTPEELPKTMKVNFMGEEREMPVEEIIQNAQKGLNYDHVNGAYQKLKSEHEAASKELGAMDELSNLLGVDRKELVTILQKQKDDQEFQQLVSQNVPEETAREMIRLRRENSKREKEEEERKNSAKAEQEKLDRQKGFEELIKAYPDVDVRKMPQEVFESIAKGMSPVAAYTRYENQQLKIKLQALEQNQKNKEKAVGSVKSTANKETADYFSAGFDEF